MLKASAKKRKYEPRSYVPRSRLSQTRGIQSLTKSQRTTVIKRSLFGGTLSASAVAFVGQGYQFQLDQLPGYTEFTTLFDQYRIPLIEFQLISLQSTGSQVGGGFTPCKLLSVVDYDDANAPATENDLLQYENVKVVGCITSHTIKFKPRIATALYGGAVFTAFGNGAAQWIDVASPSVPHYGIKLGITSAGGAGNISNWSIYVKMTIELKSAR